MNVTNLMVIYDIVVMERRWRYFTPNTKFNVGLLVAKSISPESAVTSYRSHERLHKPNMMGYFRGKVFFCWCVTVPSGDYTCLHNISWKFIQQIS